MPIPFRHAKASARAGISIFAPIRRTHASSSVSAPRVSAAALDESVIDNLMTHVLTRENLRPIADALAEFGLGAQSGCHGAGLCGAERSWMRCRNPSVS